MTLTARPARVLQPFWHSLETIKRLASKGSLYLMILRTISFHLYFLNFNETHDLVRGQRSYEEAHSQLAGRDLSHGDFAELGGLMQGH